jgi:hypothetical protein
MAKPNFFIVGAPKCGTTSLISYLLDHPKIYAPGTWELNYLNSDLTWVSDPPVTSDEEYLSHFEDTDKYDCIGEKSAFYLYSKNAPHRIHKISPHPKIICMLRDPVEAMWSLYRYHIRALRENIGNFGEAINAQESRKEGDRIPREANFVEELYYKEIYKYPEQINRYIRVFGKETVKFIVFDDFVSNTNRVYRQVLEFLGTDPISLSSYETKNENTETIGLGMRRFLERHSVLRRIVRTIFPHKLKQSIKKATAALTKEGASQGASMDPALRAELNEEFRPVAEQTERLIGQDLSHWCTVDQ